MARATFEDMEFRRLAADRHPTYSTLARVRERNHGNFHARFLRVVKLGQEADFIEGPRMALDGTKVKANASKHQAMSHGKLLEKEKELDEELRKSIDDYFRKVAENDAEEDRRVGKGKNPYNSIPGRKTAADRREKIRKAIEAWKERERPKAKATKRAPGPIDLKTQYNFTDPDSRIVPDGANRGSLVQVDSYPALVDEKATQAPQDRRQLVPMTELTRQTLGFRPREMLSDAGYFSQTAIRVVD